MRGTAILVGAATPTSITRVLEELADAAGSLADDGVEIDAVLVSRDTAVVDSARAVAKAHDLVLHVLHSPDSGAWATQQLAFEQALKHSNPDFVVTLDAAGHHDARQLPDLLLTFRSTGSGVTIGSRWIHGGSAHDTRLPRRLLSRFASRLVAWATGLRRIHDITTSFRVIRADAAGLVASDPASRGDYGFYCEFVAVAQAYGFAVEEVPITFRPRFTTIAPLRARDLLEFAGDVRRIRRRVHRVRVEMQDDQAAWAARSGRMRVQAAEIGSEFGALEELGELSGAQHFTDWIVDALRPAFGPHILEVGAGLGAVSRTIAASSPERSVVAIEPAGNVYATLVERCRGLPNITTRQVTSRELTDTFDTVLYVNVLEHIADDDQELRTAFGLVRPGGALGLFVPAMPALYGSLDYKSGHYRRYTPRQLSGVISGAGFEDVCVRYLDPLGVAPYWLMYRLFEVDHLDAVSSTGYDRVVVPVSRALEHVLPRPPFGKNLIAIARKPSP